MKQKLICKKITICKKILLNSKVIERSSGWRKLSNVLKNFLQKLKLSESFILKNLSNQKAPKAP